MGGGTSCSSRHREQMKGAILCVCGTGTGPLRCLCLSSVDAGWVLVLGVSDAVGAGGCCPCPRHARWRCWCPWRDGKLPWDKQSHWSLQHPILWHHLRERAKNSPEL